MIKKSLIKAASGLALGLCLAGCSSVDQGRQHTTTSARPGWNQLRPGMTYTEVGRILGPIDPDIRNDIKEILEQEREGMREYAVAIRELRAAGIESSPPLSSRITLDRGDYVLAFKDGRLVSCASR